MDQQPRPSPAITEFQQSCQRYFVCYTCASIGFLKISQMFLDQRADPTKDLLVGSEHPDKGKVHAKIKIGEVIKNSKDNGAFSDLIAKSFITAMYSEWDELYRQKVASEVGTNLKNIKSDLMGDLRLIRNCIVHNKSVITDEHNKMKELKWTLSPGYLTITKEMFSSLIDMINRMLVRIEAGER